MVYPEAAVDAASARKTRRFLVNATTRGRPRRLARSSRRLTNAACRWPWIRRGAAISDSIRGFPPTLGEGADALVLSVHKTLTGFTQSALVLARDDRIDLETLDAAFELGHTTSPSAAILASIDRARALVEERGAELSGRALEMAGGPASSCRRFPE